MRKHRILPQLAVGYSSTSQMLCSSKVRLLLHLLALLPYCLHGAPALWSVMSQMESTQMGQALRHFNDVFLSQRTAHVALDVVSERNTAQYYFDDLMCELLKQLHHMKVAIASRDFDYFNYYSILLVDSYRSFRTINPGRLSKHEDFSEYYLIVLHGDAMTEMQRIFDYCWRHYIINVDVLVERGAGNVALYTYSPFSESHCRSAVPIRLDDEYNVITALSAEKLFPMKLRNLHGCSIVAVLWHVPPYLMLPKLGRSEFDGMEGYLLVMLAKLLNFSVVYITPPNNEQRGLVLSNGSVTGAIKILQQKQGDLSLGSFRCTIDRSNALSSSIAFHQTMQVFTVLSTHKAFSTYEILAYPFDFYVWSSLLCLLSGQSVGAFVMQRWEKNALKFLYGFRYSSFIVFNLSAATIGQICHPLPRRNFARFLLTMWFLLTLVLRSSYQGLLYDFLSSQKAIAPPNTMAELTQRGFKLVVNTATYDSFSGVHIVRDKLIDVIVLNISDTGGFIELEQNRSIRYVTGNPLDFLVNYVNSNGKAGVFHVVKEPIFPQQLCIYFTKHSFLTKPFNEILVKLRSFGLLNYWSKIHIGEMPAESYNNTKNLPLTMTQLYGIFQIQFYLWTLATLVFVGELLLLKKSSPHNINI